MVELGYTSAEFYQSTPIEIESALDYSEKKKEYDTLTNIMPIAEAIRQNTLIYFNSKVDRKDQIKDSRKLMMFAWEVEAMKNKAPLTTEQMKSKLQHIAAAFGAKESK